MTSGITTPGAGWRRADGPAAQKSQKRRRKGGRRGRNAEIAMVEEAEFTSYYGRPIIKPPVWKTPDVPLYLFLGERRARRRCWGRWPTSPADRR
ncbi:hypothetical protein [Blastococcus brunescens]|uniref:Uncharacterized protein n=1 Tax=Blastococcus brunescens TaxID=1564165 RepID=A0ABZ1B0H3_9ACTN|nr:hypothetical protein [Blastococcus sp. BMG 8361]WRL64280.1 hypothetical protein U6N30_32865 [Blastococcus sp. BMG 8361]